MKSIQLELRYALVFSIASLAWVTLEKLLGFHDERIAGHFIFTMMFFIPAVSIYVIALLAKRRQLGGYASFKQLFFSGVIIGLFVSILSIGATYITHSIISPDYFANITNYSVENKLMTEQAAKAQFNLKSYMMQGAIGAVFAGIITSAILSIFIKRKAPLPQQELVFS